MLHVEDFGKLELLNGNTFLLVILLELECLPFFPSVPIAHHSCLLPNQLDRKSSILPKTESTLDIFFKNH